MNIAVIIPARNEAGALGAVLAEIPRDVVHQVIVVDNGSMDDTAGVARAGGASVISESRAGYGRACLAGLSILEPSIETVVFMDGDHSDYPEELPRLIEPIAQGRAELVIGSRIALAQPGSLTLQQRVGNRLACALMHGCFGVRYTDLGPFRAIRRGALERLAMADQTFGWTVEMQAKAAKLGLVIEEVSVRYRPRIGRSKISGTFTGTIRAGSAILSTIARVAWGPTPRSHAPQMRRLLIFLKYPTPGQVKTRLASTIGDEAASGVYRACVELTLERLRGFQKQAMLCVEPAEAIARTRAWLGPEWTLSAQYGHTLGDRLAHATAAAFAEGGGPVVMIGTDSPWLESSDLDEAFAALTHHDVVIGPSTDGGYYLIGLSRALPSLFDDIPWSTPDVYAETVAKARALGVRIHTLREGHDIDQLADVQRFLDEESMRGRTSASLTTIAALSHRREPCRS